MVDIIKACSPIVSMPAMTHCGAVPDLERMTDPALYAGFAWKGNRP